ncbi:DNA-directed RNA polymerase [Campylobacter hyointestinalis]|uniref:DNA-directed RNA polymerase n=1 Tax=Campylobacter hyointestinalis TaxID=198 RepID=UPI000CE46ADF|nr:DNA-directed RNA polymerase [Campylobacter hyointestinalis]PPB54641.1 hypothetical protein CDQ67_07575 [Campylobacter hyointestinalis subsp. hyointestinalis]
MEQFSRKALIKELRKDVECMNSINLISSKILQWKQDYLDGKISNIYPSKTSRLSLITEDSSSDLAVSLLFTCIMMQENTFQSYAWHLASQMRFDMSEWDKVKTASELLGYCNGLGYTINRPILGRSEYYTITPSIFIDTDTAQKINLCFFTPPSTDGIELWTNNHNGGYSFEKHNAILGTRINNHNEYLNLEVLNILGKVKYKHINAITDIPEKPSSEWSNDAVELFNKEQKTTRFVLDLLRDKEFQFVWQYDKRGRAYSKGYHTNVQGNSYRKASLEFAKKEILTPRGIHWLKVDIANNYGLDKEQFNDRVKWVDNNIDSILENIDPYLTRADEPLLFKRAILAYKDGVIEGKPIGHICQLDATCSGPQIMSTIMRDVEAMKVLNVLGDRREDFYTLIARSTYEECPDSELFKDMDFKKIRSLIKKPIMTHFYNSTAKPRELLGDDTKELRAFYKALDTYASGANNLMKAINGCWVKTKDLNKWVLPDGHTAYVPVTKTTTKRFSVDEMKAQLSFDITEQQPNDAEKLGLCPNIIHSLDAWILRVLTVQLNEMNIELSPIHDSFGVHPNYCDTLRECYRGILARLYREDIIDDILTQVASKEVKVDRPAYDKDIDLAIRTNKDGYYIC